MNAFLEIIEENFAKIKNPELVNCIFTKKYGKNEFYIAALMVDGKEIPLTVPESRLNYPFNPISWLANFLGLFYMENFSVYNDFDLVQYCVNKNNLSKFTYSLDADNKHVNVTANFKNGHSQKLYGVRKSQFKKYNRIILEKLESETQAL